MNCVCESCGLEKKIFGPYVVCLKCRNAKKNAELGLVRCCYCTAYKASKDLGPLGQCKKCADRIKRNRRPRPKPTDATRARYREYYRKNREKILERARADRRAAKEWRSRERMS